MIEIKSIMEEIQRMEERIQFLDRDRTVMISAWAGPTGYTPYNHGPYLRRMEKRRLRAKIRRRRNKLNNLLNKSPK